MTTTTASSSSSDTADPRDPSGFLKLDPSGRPSGQETPTVVKIVGTARDDLNGLLGFCTSYNRDRERYMVRMASVDSANAPHATIMALKPSNLCTASRFETYKALAQQIRTDPRIRQKLLEYYEFASNKCRPFRLEQLAGAVLVAMAALWYCLGFTRTLMLVSCLVMIGCILVEDVVRQRSPWRVVVQNFPSRCNFVVCKQFPFLHGKMTDTVAAGLVGLLVLFTLQSVFFTGASTKATPSSSSSFAMPSTTRVSPKNIDRVQLEEYYNLGYQDSLDGKDRGHSFAASIQRLLVEDDNDDEDDLTEIPYTDTPLTTTPPPATPATVPPRSFFQRLTSMRTAGSIFYLYRMAMQIGVEPSTGIFSFAQLAANIQHHMPTWQKGMLAFSCYNLVSNLFF